jgi:hypothetical protein
MQHRTTVDAIETPAGYVVKWPGGLVETIPGERFLQMFPPAEISADKVPLANLLMRQKEVVGVTPMPPHLPQDDPAYPASEDAPEKDDIITKVCISCGMSSRNIMPSGKCFNCAIVKCPTCGHPTKRAEMSGNYCPICLGGRKPRGTLSSD